MNYAQIGDLTQGMNVDGARELYDTINSEAIRGAQGALINETTNLCNTLREGWSGIAVENFIQKIYDANNQVDIALENMRNGIEAQFTSLTQTWVEQDKNIVTLD